MPAQLVALNDGPSILLDKPILLLGRDMECDIRIDSRKISRRHCCIAQVGDRLVVRDLGSTNGVRVNGIRVVEGYLKAGDELTIGSFRYQVRWDGPLAVRTLSKNISKQERGVERQEVTARAPVEDALLEECDEPVPLPDPYAAPVEKRASEQRKPTNLDVGDGKAGLDDEPPARVVQAILPDELELAPASDVIEVKENRSDGSEPARNLPSPSGE
jgi:pSer/pThr/pTyr-binding forkhead associated (FHA) protein